MGAFELRVAECYRIGSEVGAECGDLLIHKGGVASATVWRGAMFGCLFGGGGFGLDDLDEKGLCGGGLLHLLDAGEHVFAESVGVAGAFVDEGVDFGVELLGEGLLRHLRFALVGDEGEELLDVVVRFEDVGGEVEVVEEVDERDRGADAEGDDRDVGR